MGHSFLHTHPSPLLVLKGTQSEGESSGLLLNLGEHRSRRLHLQLVVDIGTLVNGGPRGIRLGLFD